MSHFKREDFITRQMIRDTLKRLLSCYDNFKIYRESSALGEITDPGRRNSTLSEATEKYLAQALQKKFPKTSADGRPGTHDVLIPELDNRYIECKLTSKFDLQVDVSTLKNKQPLDHIFFIANDKFDAFVVLHFTNLTVEDFHIPSSSSKGKASMIKYRAMNRCNVLYGNVVKENDRHISNIKFEILDATKQYASEIQRIKNRKTKIGIAKSLQKCKDRLDNKIAILENRMEYWQVNPVRYSFLFEDMWDDSLEFETTIVFPEINTC